MASRPPLSKPAFDDLLQREFGENVQRARDILTEYQGVEQLRVWVAALCLSERNLDKLKQCVAIAQNDYRDMLANAEEPNLMRLPVDAPSDERRAAEETDRIQFCRWLV